MAIDRAGALIDLIREHHLVDAGQLEELGRTPDVMETPPQLLGQCLIEMGWLTPYQVECLIQQRTGDLFLGAYHLLDRLGQGETGPVFLARKPGKTGTVVLKSIPKPRLADPQLLSLFQQEVRIAAQLQHPNIAPVSAVGQHGNLFLFAREFVPGADLGRMVRELGPLPPFLACNAVRQAALALQCAHDKGLSHRRVKAFNLIVVDQPGADGTVKLVDFGLGRLSAGTAAGLDVAGDLAALGQTLCFLMTGQTSPAVNGLPAEVGEIVRRFGPDAANRFSTAWEVSEALAPLCHEPSPGPAPFNGDMAAPAIEPVAVVAVAAVPLETPADPIGDHAQPVKPAHPLEGVAVPVMGTVGIAAELEVPSVAPPVPESSPAISSEVPLAMAELASAPVAWEPAIAAPPLADPVLEAPAPPELPKLEDWPATPSALAPAFSEPAPDVGIAPSLTPVEASRPILLTDDPVAAPAPYSPSAPSGYYADQPPSTVIADEQTSGYSPSPAVEAAPRPIPSKKGWRKKDIIWVIIGSIFWLIAGILVVVIIMIRSNRAEPPKNRPTVPGKQKNKSRAEGARQSPLPPFASIC